MDAAGRGAHASLTEPGQDAAALQTTLTLTEGTHHDLVFELFDTAPTVGLPAPEWLWEATEAAWLQAIPTFDASIAPHDARHSYAVLRGLTSAGGGMVAAATMGLPERAAQGRNYDYRCVWIRDQCYTGQAVAVDGPHLLLDDAVRFVTERLLADGPDLKPAYTITGGAVPGERSLQLPGYPGGTDIVGNHANTQFQLDTFGEALLLFAAAASHDHLDSPGQRAVTAAVAAIAVNTHRSAAAPTADRRPVSVMTGSTICQQLQRKLIPRRRPCTTSSATALHWVGPRSKRSCCLQSP